MNSQRYCRKVCKKSGSNFVYSFYLLPKKRRLALEAFYAFCRLVDDVVDSDQPPAKAAQALTQWRQEVENIYAGKPNHPVGLALAPVVKSFKVPKKYFLEIISGCETDLTQKQFDTFVETDQYCYRVAACVGLVCLHLFEVDLTEATVQAGIALGKALQWTNIVRDIASDLSLGRIYLPQEDLNRFGVALADLQSPTENSLALLDLIYFQIKRARAYYAQAWESFPSDKKQKKRLIAAFLMGKIYERLLDKVARNPLQVFAGKVSVSGEEKLAIAFKIWFSLL